MNYAGINEIVERMDVVRQGIESVLVDGLRAAANLKYGDDGYDRLRREFNDLFFVRDELICCMQKLKRIADKKCLK